MKNYVVVDLETTGYSPQTSDILEIGAWKIKDGVVVDKFCTLVRPVMYIPKSIQELTGITMNDVQDCEPIEPVLIEFFDWCEDLPFLGHNLKFDYEFLCYKGQFLELDFTLRGTRSGIDTLALSRKLLSLKSNKLKDVTEHFGIHVNQENSGFHRAGYDSYITKLVYDRFLYGYSSVFAVTTPELLSLKDDRYGKAVNNETLSFD